MKMMINTGKRNPLDGWPEFRRFWLSRLNSATPSRPVFLNLFCYAEPFRPQKNVRGTPLLLKFVLRNPFATKSPLKTAQDNST